MRWVDSICASNARVLAQAVLNSFCFSGVNGAGGVAGAGGDAFAAAGTEMYLLNLGLTRSTCLPGGGVFE